MPVTSNNPAPYAPASAVLDLISKHRNRGLPTPINFEVLGRSGITDSLVPRTIQALKTLDLIDADGKPTPTFESLRLAPEPEYRQRILDWLNTAYADVLCFVDPATVDELTLRDAFRSYTPIGQQSRMVTLFTGLYSAAGIREEKIRVSGGKRQKQTVASNVTSKRALQKPPVGQDGTQKPPFNPRGTPPGGQGGVNPEGEANGFERELLAKFPLFDPSWSEDLKTSWFRGFHQFMEMAKAKS